MKIHKNTETFIKQLFIRKWLKNYMIVPDLPALHWVISSFILFLQIIHLHLCVLFTRSLFIVCLKPTRPYREYTAVKSIDKIMEIVCTLHVENQLQSFRNNCLLDRLCLFRDSWCFFCKSLMKPWHFSPSKRDSIPKYFNSVTSSYLGNRIIFHRALKH